MPAMICPACGGLTNTAYRYRDGLGNTACRTRINIERAEWERGCLPEGMRDVHEGKWGRPVEINGQAMTPEWCKEMRERLMESAAKEGAQ